MARSPKGTAQLNEGDKAPDFSLPGTKGGAGHGKGFDQYTQASFPGKHLVLAFYPAAFTPV